MRDIRVVRPYAKAAFEYALEHQKLAAWKAWLQVAADIVQDTHFMEILQDPRWTKEAILQIFEDILEKTLDAGGKHFLQLLSDYRRLPCLPYIAQTFNAFLADYEQTMEVEIVSAMELTAEQRKQFQQALEKKFGRKATVYCTVDEQLLGGAMLRVGDRVIEKTGRSVLAGLHRCIKGTLCK